MSLGRQSQVESFEHLAFVLYNNMNFELSHAATSMSKYDPDRELECIKFFAREMSYIQEDWQYSVEDAPRLLAKRSHTLVNVRKITSSSAHLHFCQQPDRQPSVWWVIPLSCVFVLLWRI